MGQASQRTPKTQAQAGARKPNVSQRQNEQCWRTVKSSRDKHRGNSRKREAKCLLYALTIHERKGARRGRLYCVVLTSQSWGIRTYYITEGRASVRGMWHGSATNVPDAGFSSDDERNRHSVAKRRKARSRRPGRAGIPGFGTDSGPGVLGNLTPGRSETIPTGWSGNKDGSGDECSRHRCGRAGSIWMPFRFLEKCEVGGTGGGLRDDSDIVVGEVGPRALKEYRKRTGKELITHPLAEEIASCDSPKAILAVLQGKANELNQSQSGDERLTKWLTPTVNVLNALSATLGEGVGTVFPPTKMIFSGISIFLVAARDTAASRDALIELFDRIEDFFVRLQTYTEVPPTTEMTNVMGKILAETLSMLAIATKEMKQRPIKTFLKKVVGRNDIGDALQRLHMLEQGELRTVTAQMLKTTSDLKHDAKEIKVTVQKIVRDLNSRD
ncbi:hypothetical protein EDB84DRAFT_1678242, partial [Lactarius hengduanensis]